MSVGLAKAQGPSADSPEGGEEEGGWDDQQQKQQWVFEQIERHDSVADTAGCALVGKPVAVHTKSF